MDLSPARYDTAVSALPGSPSLSPAEAFALGISTPNPVMDLDAPDQWDPLEVDDFTQSDGLQIDYPHGGPVPDLSFYYNEIKLATEVRLDGVTVALVRMRAGHGPLRASAIELVPDVHLAQLR